MTLDRSHGWFSIQSANQVGMSALSTLPTCLLAQKYSTFPFTLFSFMVHIGRYLRLIFYLFFLL